MELVWTIVNNLPRLAKIVRPLFLVPLLDMSGPRLSWTWSILQLKVRYGWDLAVGSEVVPSDRQDLPG